MFFICLVPYKHLCLYYFLIFLHFSYLSSFSYSSRHEKQSSLEIRTVKLRFLLIYEICWKALQRPVVSAQQNRKTRRATTHSSLFLIWLTSLVMIEKRSKHRLKKEIFMIVKNIVLTKNWFVFNNFREFPKDHTEK